MRQRSAISLIPTLICLCLPFAALANEGGKARFVGSFHWSMTGGWFGGFSALELTEDGLGFVAISDRALVVVGRLERDEEGRLSGVSIKQRDHLRSRRGNPLRKPYADSEGLVLHSNGSLIVSFEGRHRLRGYAGISGAAERMTRPAKGRVMWPNGSFEALAIDPRGRLVTLIEKPNDETDHVPVFRLEEGRWATIMSIPPDSGFSVVGADYGPDDVLYVLERGFNGVWFKSRVRRVFVDGARSGQVETVFQSDFGVHDNLEGLSVWRDSGGHIRLTMISDDNFRLLQKTEFVEYILD